jgi:hypothetical protein
MENYFCSGSEWGYFEMIVARKSCENNSILKTFLSSDQLSMTGHTHRYIKRKLLFVIIILAIISKSLTCTQIDFLLSICKGKVTFVPLLN